MTPIEFGLGATDRLHFGEGSALDCRGAAAPIYSGKGPGSLTPQELDFLRARLAGISLREASAALDIHGETVEAREQVQAIQAKLQRLAIAGNPSALTLTSYLREPLLVERRRASQAAHQLQTELTFLPRLQDPLQAWLGHVLAGSIERGCGARTIAGLVDFVNENGAQWHLKIEGVGRRRAVQVLCWISSYQSHWHIQLERSAQDAVLREVVLMARQVGGVLPIKGADADAALKVYGVVPYERLLWPEDLLGNDGIFRAREPNTLGANNDKEAVEAWLLNHLHGLAENSKRLYFACIERFVLWTLVKKRKALSSLTSADLAEYREFLFAPPPEWCDTRRLTRRHSEWRPFRHPYSHSTVITVLNPPNMMFNLWTATGYLRANAFASINTRPQEPVERKPKIDPRRAFDENDLLIIRTALDQYPEGAIRTRLRASVLMIIETGLRLSEATAATWGDFTVLGLPAGTPEGTYILQVLGKGRKRRELPVSGVTIQALRAHLEDRKRMIAEGELSAGYASLEDSQLPLLGILTKRENEFVGTIGDAPACEPRKANSTGRLAKSTLYEMLKALFNKTAEIAPEERKTKFARASTHWLRHTAATRLVNTGVELEVVQGILGHAHLSTTWLYTQSAGMTQKVDAIYRVRPPV